MQCEHSGIPRLMCAQTHTRTHAPQPLLTYTLRLLRRLQILHFNRAILTAENHLTQGPGLLVFGGSLTCQTEIPPCYGQQSATCRPPPHMSNVLCTHGRYEASLIALASVKILGVRVFGHSGKHLSPGLNSVRACVCVSAQHMWISWRITLIAQLDADVVEILMTHFEAGHRRQPPKESGRPHNVSACAGVS